MSAEFKLLGTAAGPGVPAFYCNCIACQEARLKPELARTRSGAILDTGNERILVDASPDIRTQLLRANINAIDYLFITHWHYDHFGGIGDLEFYVRICRKTPLKLLLPSSAVQDFQTAYPFLMDVFELETWDFEQCFDFSGVKLHVLPANHGIQTGGILLEKERRIAYFTDTSGLPELTAKRLEGVDALICDATFHGENWYPHSHMSMEEAIKLGEKLKAKQTYLTHFAMHYSVPVTVEKLGEELLPYSQVSLAYDGLALRF